MIVSTSSPTSITIAGSVPLATITGKVTTVVKSKSGITHVIEQANGKVVNLPLENEIPVETQVRITVEDVEPF